MYTGWCRLLSCQFYHCPEMSTLIYSSNMEYACSVPCSDYDSLVGFLAKYVDYSEMFYSTSPAWEPDEEEKLPNYP